MSMPVKLSRCLEVSLFPLEETKETRKLAARSKGVVYSWKTKWRANWLEKGTSVVDVLGVVVLPQGLPAVLEMPADAPAD